MKLAVSGKGGVGKSTIAGTLARLYAADSCRVLAIDADPDANLASAVGVPPELRRGIRTIAGERRLIEERTGARVREFGQMFKLNPEVADIAERYAVRYAGVIAGFRTFRPESYYHLGLSKHYRQDYLGAIATFGEMV